MRRRTDDTGGAFLRFHMRVGVRVGLRLLAPVLAGLFAAYYLLRPELMLLAADHLLKNGDALRRGISFAVLTGMIGASIAPRVTLGLGGWLRHLPASSRRQRLWAAASLVTAELPILLPLAAAAFLLPDKNGSGPAWAAAVGMAASAFFMALFLLPVRQPLWASALGLTACILAGSGRPLLLAAAAAAAWLVDRASGPFLGRGMAVRRFGRPAAGPTAFGLRVSLRAAGGGLLWAFIPPGLCLGWAALFLGNNPLAPEPARAAVRFAAGGGIAGALAISTAILGKRRPPWPWIRSLPIGSRRRVVEDAFFLAGPALACWAVFAVFSRAALPVAGLLPYAALRASAALRPSMETPRSPVPGLVLELMLAAALAALVPTVLAFVPLLAVPAWLEAARRERAVKAGRWLERRYSADGDSLTWSSR